METKLDKKFNKLQADLNGLFERLDALPEKSLHQRPEGAWSAVQILHHLSLSEQGTVQYVNKKLSGAAVHVENAGIGAMLRSFLLQRALRHPTKKFKAPKFVADVPDQPDYTHTKQRYETVRKDMQAMLKKFDGVMLRKAYFKHPRAGKMNIVQALEFIHDHFDRHLQQIHDRSGAA
jgi:hypothetical protein